jgi:apolipoprotein N-acyltransferase
LILPVNEWKSIKNIHFHMHVFRAIENGVPLVRVAASGLSAAIDPWGRVLSVSDCYAAHLVDHVGGRNTSYSLAGV